MSYILEALKRSQQARELGQVPRLQTALREDPLPAPGPRPWLITGLVLGALATSLAAYALLRPLAPSGAVLAAAAPSPTLPVPVPPTTPALAALPDNPPSPPAAPRAAADADNGTPAPDAPGPAVGSAAETPTNADQVTERAPVPDADPAPAPVASPAPSAETSLPQPAPTAPAVLIVPAPPRPGQSLPRGADELRRAVLGPEAAGPAATEPAPPPEPANAPIPDDLIADIQHFKHQLGKPSPAGKASGRKPAPPPLALPPLPIPAPAVASAARPDTPGDPAAPPPSAALRERLPKFSMTVHVYNADSAQRFVFIDGKKLKEHERTPGGLRVEQVQPDGVVLSYEGERFFKAR